MSLKSLEEVSNVRKQEIDNWLANVVDSNRQLKNFYDLCLEQIAMESSFNSLLISNDIKLPSPPISINNIEGPRYGRKVFLGGLPVGITSEEILANFEHFGPARLDWPHKAFHENIPPAGYAFIIFENAGSVNRLIDMCSYLDYKYNIGIRMMDGGKRMIEVKPWDMKNNELELMPNWAQHDRLSVFVGGLPRTITAGELASLIQEAVGGVAYVSIEIDEQVEYPKGAARVVFNSQESYVRAIAMKELTVLSAGNERTVEIKPYLYPKMKCEMCNGRISTSFCPQVRCLKYFCDNCWKTKHASPGLTGHKPMQKGRYFLSTKSFDDKVLRRDMSRSHSIWQFPSNSSSLESLSHLHSPLLNMHRNSADPRLRFLNSCDSMFVDPTTPDISPYTAFSSNDSVFFNFKH